MNQIFFNEGSSKRCFKQKEFVTICSNLLHRFGGWSDQGIQVNPRRLVYVGTVLGGGFQDFLFSSLPGEMIQFD